MGDRIRLSSIEDRMIANAYAAGASIGGLADIWGYTVQGMTKKLETPNMLCLIANAQLIHERGARMAHLQIAINLPAVIEALTDAALSGDPLREPWAIREFTRIAGVGPETRVHHTVDGNLNTTSAPVQDSPAMQAVGKAASLLMAHMGAIDITQSRHVLEGEAARPRPEGIGRLTATPLNPVESLTFDSADE